MKPVDCRRRLQNFVRSWASRRVHLQFCAVSIFVNTKASKKGDRRFLGEWTIWDPNLSTDWLNLQWWSEGAKQSNACFRYSFVGASRNPQRQQAQTTLNFYFYLGRSLISSEVNQRRHFQQFCTLATIGHQSKSWVSQKHFKKFLVPFASRGPTPLDTAKAPSNSLCLWIRWETD